MPTVFLTVLNVSRRERAAEKTSKKVVLSGEERGGDDSSFPEHEEVLIGQNQLVNPSWAPWRAVNWGGSAPLVLRACSSPASAESSGSTH